MAKPRHPDTDRIVEEILKRTPVKQILDTFNLDHRTFGNIRDKFTETVIRRKFVPGEGQKSFFDIWKNL